MYDLLLRNGTVVTSKETFKTDIFVKDGKIVKICKFENSDTATEVYDATGLHILPGIIDAHVHFRDPGLTEKEDFETGSEAAAFGGITMIADMPNVIPPTATLELFNEKVKIAQEKSYVDFALFALLNNNNTNEIPRLVKAGVLGFKVFLGTSTGNIAAPATETLTKQLMKCASLGIRTGFHAEKSDINEYFTALCKSQCEEPDGDLLCAARPVESECKAIEEALFFAEKSGAKIHIHHVTCADGARLIEQAKKIGVYVSSETCPHYLLFNTSEHTHKCYPPIRDKINNMGLWDALHNNVIDMLATDHAPHTAAEKSLPLWSAPAGLAGVETFVPLMLNEVNKGNLSLNDFVRLASEEPAKIWGIYPQKGSISPGADADFTIADMKKKLIIKAAKLHSKSKTTPYDGWELQGAPAATIVRGKFIMRDNELTGTGGYGKLIVPKP